MYRFLLILVLAMQAGYACAVDIQPLSVSTLDIATRQGNIHFAVELATTPTELEQGLMYRKELPDRQGMLFDFGRPQPVRMWMKNTLIPLDMVFISADGNIIKIAERTTPESLVNIDSGGPVRAVLEVSGGTAEHYHIARGDKVLYQIFK
jgi:uncharacterized protein